MHGPKVRRSLGSDRYRRAMTTVRTLPATSRRQQGSWLTVASLAIAGLVAMASLLGLFADWPYQFETENWALQAQGQDVGNLLAVVVLLVATIRMRAGSVRAAQVWVGAQFYLLYAYLVYAFALHLGRLFLVYVAVLSLIAFSLIAALPAALRVPTTGRVRARRFGGAVLIGTGALFALLWLSELVPALVSGEVPASLELAGLIVNPVHVIDLSVVLPGMIVVGVLGIRGTPTGALTLPLLVFSTLMGLSIVAAMILITAAGPVGSVIPAILVGVVVAVSLAAAAGLFHETPERPVAEASAAARPRPPRSRR